jgi:hydroxyacylglutathione hydrolase
MNRTAQASRWLGAALASLALASVADAQAPLNLRWDPGAEDCTPEQARTQAQAIDETTIVIRQNPCVDYEANFLYLLIGNDRALLLDSGATEDPKLTAELTGLVASYLTRADGMRLPLLVAHTHRHLDHRAGDAAFAAQPLTKVVPIESEELRRFFGFRQWPDDEVRYDLGGRVITVAPAPGHHPDHLVFFDSRTRLLFTGDFYLPGRLLVDDIDAYVESARLMIERVQVWGPTYALGAHVEMNRAGELYSGGATHHPDERPVEMVFGVPEAQALLAALQDFNGFYSRHPAYAVVHPIHNLMALGAGVVLALVLAVWGVRRLIQGRRRTVTG